MAVKLLKTLNKGLIIGLAVALLSIFIPLVPCSEGLCKLPNPFTEQATGQEYYWTSAEPLAGFIIQTIVITLAITIIFSLFKKKSKRFVDLTRK